MVTPITYKFNNKPQAETPVELGLVGSGIFSYLLTKSAFESKILNSLFNESFTVDLYR